MKTYILIAAFLIGGITPSFSQTPEQLFQKGLIKEEGEGALNEAIDIYNKIVGNQDADKSLQAKALLHVGFCYEKLGLNEATKAYQRLVNNFPEQKSEVAIAKERLSRLIPIAAKVTPKSITLQKVMSGGATDMLAAPSPDGRFLTYLDEETGNVAIRKFSTGKTHLLTKDGTWDNPMQFTIGSTVSPNCKQVAYSWYNLNSNYEIRLINVDNPQPKVLYGNKDEDVYPSAWSPDGKIIYARSYLNKTKQSRILSINVASGDIQVLKTFDFFYWMYLGVSPDNQFIAFDVPNDKDDSNFDIHMISTDGKNETSLIKHPANDRLLGWFPNKNKILFTSNRSGTWDAWIVSVLNGKAAGEPKRLVTEIGQITPMGFTNSGTYYYSFFSRKFTAFTAPFDVIKGRLEFESVKPMLGSVPFAELSPDGKSLAFTKEIKESAGPGWYHRPLFILDIETGKERKLSDWKQMRYPQWSPDGKTLLVVGYDKERELKKDYDGGIYAITVESGKVTEVLAFSKTEVNEAGVSLYARSVAEWSKDQKSIYYTTNDKLINLELETGQEKILLQHQDLNRTLDLSPDGKSLLFCSENKLNVIQTSGGTVLQLFSVGESNKISSAVWSPDGNYILFSENMKNINDGSILWRISADGKNPQKVWQSKGPISSISIHPNGQKIVLSTFQQETEIWKVDNLMLDEETINK
ncbi:MAG: tetratricopeptide repeat protein [Ignavibacteriaceae bacterium]|nr:tetratricopeptide repeat protein [Ignavibacteriaceae bacterium]